MITLDHKPRLMETLVGLLNDHQKNFESFVRGVGNVRYCHTPIDDRQINRCGHALHNTEVRLPTIHNCIQAGRFNAETLDASVQTRYI